MNRCTLCPLVVQCNAIQPSATIRQQQQHCLRVTHRLPKGGRVLHAIGGAAVTSGAGEHRHRSAECSPFSSCRLKGRAPPAAGVRACRWQCALLHTPVHCHSSPAIASGKHASSAPGAVLQHFAAGHTLLVLHVVPEAVVAPVARVCIVLAAASMAREVSRRAGVRCEAAASVPAAAAAAAAAGWHVQP